MDRVSDIYWKTVAAEVDAAADMTAAGLDGTLSAMGFVRAAEGVYRRTSWLGVLPARHEWRTEVEPLDTGSAFSVRIGLNNGWYTYGGLAVSYAAAMACALLAAESHVFSLLWLAGICFVLPVIQGVVARFEAHAMENALWRGIAALGDLRNGQTIWRTLNRAYGRDRVVTHAPGGRP